MAGSAEVFAQIQRKPGVTYAALVPNLKGFEAAMEAGVEEVALYWLRLRPAPTRP